MPKKPTWYQQFEGIVEALKKLPDDQPIRRFEVQSLLHVGRTEATRIMSLAGSEQVGAYTIVKADALVRYLESRREDAGLARKRKNRIAHTVATERALQPARSATFKLPKLPMVGDLSADIEFQDGVLSTRYQGFEDVVGKLVSLAKAMQFDPERFRELAEAGLAAEVGA